MSELPIKSSQYAPLIVRDFEIESANEASSMSEEELLKLLSAHIDFMLESRAEQLFSLLYRMDVKEALVREALSPYAPEPANVGLARLVIERQKQRIFTKQTIRPEDLGEEWDW